MSTMYNNASVGLLRTAASQITWVGCCLMAIGNIGFSM